MQAIWILRRLALRAANSRSGGSWLSIYGKIVIVGSGHALEWTIEEGKDHPVRLLPVAKATINISGSS
jgi:hypothetical protein